MRRGGSKKAALTPELQRKRMLTVPIPKLIIGMIIPTVLSQLITVIYNTADTFFVARIGTSAAAAVGVVFSLQSIMQAYGFGVGTGCGSLVARCLGAAQNEKAESYANSALLAGLVGSLVIMIPSLIFLPQLMRLLGSTDTMLDYCVSYARIILMGCPFLCTSSVMSCILRNEGEPIYAVVGLVIGGFFNVILDPVLIFWAHWGIAGAAAATIVSQALSWIILLRAFLAGKSIVKINPRSISRRWRDYFEIYTTGIPTTCRQGMASLGSAVLNIYASHYGDSAVAAVTISNKIYLFVRNVIIGVGQGFQPVAGFNFGAGDKERTRQAFIFSTQLGTVICVVAAVFIGFNTELVMSWFRGDDPAVIAIGKSALLFACAVMPLMAYSTFVNQLYQCLGFKLAATMLACCRNGFFLIPVVLVLPRFIGVGGVEMAQPLADFLTFVISVPFQISFFRKHLRT